VISGPLDVALLVTDALEAIGAPYVVGGSIASAIAGEPRTTLDVDMVVAIGDADVDRLVAALGPDFYADDEAIRRAVRERSSVNLIHRPSAIKIDIFIAGGTPVDDLQIERRRLVKVNDDPERHIYAYTPEDILLQKLRWYRLGREVSDRQWRDILGIVLVQGEALDVAYLRRVAPVLDVVDLLDRALVRAGGGDPQSGSA
jgi:hypothetical protein